MHRCEMPGLHWWPGAPVVCLCLSYFSSCDRNSCFCCCCIRAVPCVCVCVSLDVYFFAVMLSYSMPFDSLVTYYMLTIIPFSFARFRSFLPLIMLPVIRVFASLFAFWCSANMHARALARVCHSIYLPPTFKCFFFIEQFMLCEKITGYLTDALTWVSVCVCVS